MEQGTVHRRIMPALKWALIGVGILLTLALIVTGIGYALPVAHTAHRSVVLKTAPSELWATITDVGAYPAWRTDVDAVELLSPVNGRPRWREKGSNGDITYVMTVDEPPARMVSRIAGDDLPFGGEWEYEITPVEGGSRVAITERGEIYNPVFRVVSRFFLGYTSNMDAYLTALGARFGEIVVPTTTPVRTNRYRPVHSSKARLHVADGPRVAEFPMCLDLDDRQEPPRE